MRQLAIAVGLGAVLLLLAGQADAQYRYTDDKGVSKTTQYKLDVPAPYRDAAVWVGPTGIGKPALSEEARQTKLRDDAYRRIGEANAALIPYLRAEAAQRAAAAERALINEEKAEKAKEQRAVDRAEQSLHLQQESVNNQERSIRLQDEANRLQQQQQYVPPTYSYGGGRRR